MKEKLKRIFTLLTTFLRIGAFTFGGGYAMIPLVQREVVEKHKWISDDDVLEVIAIAESTPGPIAINMATFVGYRVAGFFGSLAATFGVVFPSFVIIYIISFILRQFQENIVVKYAFSGIRAGVLALLCKSLYSMYKKVKKHVFAYIIMAAAFIVSAFIDIHVLWIIGGCALAGLIYSLIAEKAKGGKTNVNS